MKKEKKKAEFGLPDEFGEREGSAVKSTGYALSEDPGSIYSTQMAAHNCPRGIPCFPLTSIGNRLVYGTKTCMQAKYPYTPNKQTFERMSLVAL